MDNVRILLHLTDLMGFSRVGDMDVRTAIQAAMDLYDSKVSMKSVTGSAVCDAADTTGNDVSINWWVVDPEDVP